MPTGLPFDDVLAAAQAGAAWAFEVLYRDLSPSVTGYLRLHGAAEPDDLASETFLGVFTGLAGFCGDEARAARLGLHHRPPPARRRLAAPQPPSPGGRRRRRPGRAPRRRRRGRRPGPASAPTPSSSCAAALPDDQRAVILLRILADLTIEQVAQAMGRSVASVKALQRRGLRALRTELERTLRKSSVPSAYPYATLAAMTGVR